MKSVEFVLGLALCAGAIATLASGINDLTFPIFSAGGLSEMAAVLVATAVYALFSIWSFKSALRNSSNQSTTQ